MHELYVVMQLTKSFLKLPCVGSGLELHLCISSADDVRSDLGNRLWYIVGSSLVISNIFTTYLLTQN